MDTKIEKILANGNRSVKTIYVTGIWDIITYDKNNNKIAYKNDCGHKEKYRWYIKDEKACCETNVTKRAKHQEYLGTGIQG